MWLNSAMRTLIPLLTISCGLFSADPQEPTNAPREAVIPEPEDDAPNLNCPESTKLESGSSSKGVEYWCDREGVMHGPYVQYHPNAERTKAISGSYDNNDADGSWIWWHENGEPRSKGKYNKGKQTGAWTWWHENGQRKEEGDFLQGRRQGQWTEFFESGLKKSEGMYHNDMKNGVWTFFNDDSENSVAKTQTYQNNEMTEEKVINDKSAKN
ncbi:MAG: hypothetical protein KTR31_03110 [Myxococcales bacterium]|nr:hypothetical protein [Myxococcales bacterium]